MITKTYGIYGMLDFVAALPVGRATLNIHFSGGGSTLYGMSPAEYTTPNAAVQAIIEDSAYYRSGRIVLLDAHDDGEPDPSMPLMTTDDVPPYIVDPTTCIPNDDAMVDKPVAVTEATEAKDTALPKTQPEPQPLPNPDVVPTTVNVSCVEDAAAYLKEHHGIATRNCRNATAAKRLGEQLGIAFEGL